MGKTNKFAWLTRTALAGVLMAAPFAIEEAHAQNQPREFHLNIPSQPLSEALRAYAQATGQQIVFSEELVAGRNAVALAGDYTAEAALERLLAGSGLVAVRTPRGALMVLAAGDPRADASSPTQFAGDVSAPSEEEEIVVVGTYLRGVAPAGQQLVIIDEDDIREGGFATAGDVIRSLPQSFNGTTSQDLGLSRAPSAENETGLDLRGFGPGTTLVLMNGRRLAPSGFFGNVVGVSTIPLTAVERVEVLPDGASALYGSDAVGGVINYVLKDDVSGAETMARYGAVTNGGRSEYQIGQNFGLNWNGGHIFVAGEYFEADPLYRFERPQSLADRRPYGGTDNRLTFCNPGTITVGTQTYAIPAGQDGTSLTPSDFTAGTRNLCDHNAGLTLLSDERRSNLFATLEQRVMSGVEVFADLNFVERDVTNVGAGISTLVVPDTNAFYVNPAGGFGQIRVNYDRNRAFGDLALGGSESSIYYVTLGARFELPHDWQVETYVNRGEYRTTRPPVLNSPTGGALNAALADGNPSTAFNPFGDLAVQNPNTLRAIFDENQLSSRHGTEQDIAHALLSGTIMSLPAGDWRFAVGAEYRDVASDATQVRVSAGVEQITASARSRSVESIFAETFIPLLRTAGGQRLELSLAGRYEDYSDFGSAFVPRVGGTWALNQDLSFRASWSQSFRAPDLGDLDELTTTASISDRASPTGPGNVVVLFLQGGNSNLAEENAASWTFGVDYRPSIIRNLALSLTYFDILYEDKIDRLSFLGDLGSPLLQPFLTGSPTAEQREWACGFRFTSNASTISPGPCISADLDYILDIRVQNLGEVLNRGLDAQVSYSPSSPVGDLSFSLAATYLLEYELTVADGATPQSVLNTALNPLRLRLRGSAGWSYGPLSATFFVNYQNSYVSTRTPTPSLPRYEIDSWTTVDVTTALDLEEANPRLAGLSLSLSAQNVFDEDPPIYYQPGVGGSYDPANADLLGRLVSLTLRKRW